MRLSETGLRRALWVLAAALALAAAGCGGSDGGSTNVATDAPETQDAGGITEETDTTVGMLIDVCSVVPADSVAEVFPSGAPEGEGNDYGPDSGDCTWENDEAFLEVSVVPAENFQSDFVDQLNVTGPVTSAELGEEAVSFPGTVGIGSAAAGGATVGFVVPAGPGILVAVRTGAEGGPNDLALATSVAEAIATIL